MTLIPSQTGRPFIKMHGLQNHFVIVDGRVDSFAPTVNEIVAICDANVGVGADELIVIEPTARDADVFMRIFNSDGREVEACGNATRCVAWLIFAENDSDQAVIETLAGRLQCHKAGDKCVTAEMGKVTMNWQSVPLSAERDTLHLGLVSGALADPVALNVGNPHAVFFVENLKAIDVEDDAPAIQQNELFPDSVNVSVAEIVNPQKMLLKVFERGEGLTMACGSGACAAVFAAQQRKLTGETKMEVELPGGVVTIEIRDDDTAVMTGPIAISFSGNLA